MSLITNKKRFHLLNEDEPPEKKVVSDGDILIKELTSKQCDTNVTLKSELAKRKDFLKSTEFISITASASGYNSFEDFKKINDGLNKIEELKSVGLTKDEIKLLEDSEKGEEYLHRKRKNLAKLDIKSKLNEINSKIINENKAKIYNLSNNDVGGSSRHLQELGFAVKPNSTETKLFKFALNNKTSNINQPCISANIQELEKTLNAKIETKLVNVEKIRAKARKLGAKACNKEKNVAEQLPSDTKSTNWDVQVKDVIKINKHNENKVYTCLPQNVFTIQNGQIVKLNKECNENNIITPEKKLTLQDIRSLPKFENYETGNPSNILYLKNLPGNVTINDLKYVFKNYDNDKLIYKILEKRLKGRAFIYFTDKHMATKALHDLLGIYLKNKPLIIEFGKRNNDNVCT